MPLCCHSHCTFCTDLLTGKCWHYHGSSDCFDNQKKPCLNQATQKNICQIFQHKKIPRIKNFKPPKILQSSPTLEIKSTCNPPPPTSSRAPAKLHRAYISDYAARTWRSQSSVCGEKTLTYYNLCIRMIQYMLQHMIIKDNLSFWFSCWQSGLTKSGFKPKRKLSTLTIQASNLTCAECHNYINNNNNNNILFNSINNH